MIKGLSKLAAFTKEVSVKPLVKTFAARIMSLLVGGLKCTGIPTKSVERDTSLK